MSAQQSPLEQFNRQQELAIMQQLRAAHFTISCQAQSLSLECRKFVAREISMIMEKIMPPQEGPDVPA